MTQPALRHLVLAGGGHSHVLVLAALIGTPEPRLRLTVVSPGPYTTYSGMVPGVMGGRYTLREAQIDVEALARRAGSAFVAAYAVGVDAAQRSVTLSDGSALHYDLLSFDIGSQPARAAPIDADAPVIFLKPIERAVTQLDAALAGRAAGHDRHVVVVGGGAGGSEVALALSARRLGGAITVCDGEAHPAHSLGARTARQVERVFTMRGIRFIGNARVARVTRRAVELADGRELAADLIIWATGPAAPELFAASGLPVDRHGFLLVDATLQCPAYPEILAAGDCMTISAHPDLPKAGVFAVREAPVLAHNLAAAARGAPLRQYRPQRRFLALLNSGDGRAILSYGGVAYHGRGAWWLKDWIDRRFVAQFTRLIGA
jgi:selenide,water dikinase